MSSLTGGYVSRRRWIAWSLIAVAGVGALLLLWAVRPVLAPFFFAVVIAYMVSPIVNLVVAQGLGRGAAIAVTYGALGLLLVFGVWKVIPGAVAELSRLAESIPHYSAALREAVADLQWQVHHSGAPSGLKQALDTAIRDVELRSTQLLASLLAMNNLRRLAEVLLSLVLAPVLAYYMLKDMDRFKAAIIRAVPQRYRQDTVVLLRAIDNVLAGFIRGQLILALAVGLLAAFATYLLGLRYALLLGLFAGLTELIPYIGPVIGAIPAVIAGLTVSPLTALQVAIAFAIIQQFENAVLSPKVIGERVGLHPLAVLLVLLGGGYLFGAWGVILALPVAGTLRVTWQFALRKLTAPPIIGPDA